MTQGLVLSGGGTYAAYEVGVMKALLAGASPATNRTPVDPMVVSGTSAGAFNAASFVSMAEESPQCAIERLEHVWLNDIAANEETCVNGVYRNLLDPRAQFAGSLVNPLETASRIAGDTGRLTNFFVGRTLRAVTDTDRPLEQRLLAMFDLTAFIRVEPFERTVRATIKPKVIRQSNRLLRIAATNWDTGELSIFGNADMSDELAPLAVLASAAIPGFFPPVSINGTLFVDGGVVMNTPLQPAIAAGADVLHVIYLDPDIQQIETSRLDNVFTAFDRVLMLARADIMERDIEAANRINQELAADPDVASGILSALSPVPRTRKLRPLEIHRYRPSTDFGGMLGALNVERDHLQNLIAHGYGDATTHDCLRSGCVLV